MESKKNRGTLRRGVASGGSNQRKQVRNGIRAQTTKQNDPQIRRKKKRAGTQPRLHKPKAPRVQVGVAQLTSPAVSPATVFGVYRPKSLVNLHLIAEEPFGIGVKGFNRAKPMLRVLLIAKEPFGPGRKSIVLVSLQDGEPEATCAMTTLDASDCEFLGHPVDFGLDEEILAAALKVASKKYKPIVSFGNNVRATLHYISAGGKVSPKSTEFDDVELQIFKRWPRWQKHNLRMQARAEEVGLTEGQLTTRLNRMGLKPNLQLRRRESRQQRLSRSKASID